MGMSEGVSSSLLSAAAEADGIDPLITILWSKRDGAVANAATVLTNMAMQEPLRSTIQSRGVMLALLQPLRSANTVVQSKAALTVAATACDVEARNEVRASQLFYSVLMGQSGGHSRGFKMILLKVLHHKERQAFGGASLWAPVKQNTTAGKAQCFS